AKPTPRELRIPRRVWGRKPPCGCDFLAGEHRERKRKGNERLRGGRGEPRAQLRAEQGVDRGGKRRKTNISDLLLGQRRRNKLARRTDGHTPGRCWAHPTPLPFDRPTTSEREKVEFFFLLG
ncbi:unnamed protein product, partial [Ectocarpus sp. 13 AM-2016]